MPFDEIQRAGSTNSTTHVTDLLAAYIHDTLNPAQRQRVRLHILACMSCHDELALRQAVVQAAQAQMAALPLPSLALLDGVWTKIDAAQAPTVATEIAPATTPANTSIARQRRRWGAGLWQVALGQAALVPRGIWVASTAAMAIGFLTLLLSNDGHYLAFLLGFLAPVVTAVSVAFLYGPENDPALEIARSTPTSPRVVLLSRLSLVLGYQFSLTLGGTLLVALAHGGNFALFASFWVGPMLLLTGLSLLISVGVSTASSLMVTAALWFPHLFTSALSSLGSVPPAISLPINVIWQTNPTILLLALALFALAIFYAPRQERLARE